MYDGAPSTGARGEDGRFEPVAVAVVAAVAAAVVAAVARAVKTRLRLCSSNKLHR